MGEKERDVRWWFSFLRGGFSWREKREAYSNFHLKMIDFNIMLHPSQNK
jgi:hypothetical protein